MVKIDDFQIRFRDHLFEFDNLTIHEIHFELADGVESLSYGDVLHSRTSNEYSFGSRDGFVAAIVARSIDSIAVKGKISMFVEMRILEGEQDLPPNSLPDEAIDMIHEVCSKEVYDKVWDDIFGNISEYYGFTWSEKFDIPEGKILGEKADA